MSKNMMWHVWEVTYLLRNVTIVCGASYHLLGSWTSRDSKIWFQLQVKSYISDWQFSESRHLARYISCHNTMAYDRLIDVWHYNAYLLVPRLVYHLSTKLKNNAIHNRIGQTDEVKLIHFLTRYGYATRTAPFCKLHGACGKYTNMQNLNYVNNCDNWNRIIPVTVFLVMLFNACFMYQPKADTNLLITALNGFDYDQWDVCGHTE